MIEDSRLDTEFRLNVKGMTTFSGLTVTGTITAAADGTASKKFPQLLFHHLTISLVHR